MADLFSYKTIQVNTRTQYQRNMAKEKDPLEMTIPEYRLYLSRHGFPEEKCTDSQIVVLRDFIDQYSRIAVDVILEQQKKREATSDQKMKII